MNSDNRFGDFMQQLSRALHGGETNKEVSIVELLPEARKQAVDGMLYDIPGIILPHDENLRMRCIGNVLALEKQNAWMNVQVANLAQRLDEHHICYAVMKGQTCAAFYPHPLHRRMGDIDVYVAPNDFDRANQLLVEWGAVLVDKTMLHSTYQWGQLDIEVHFAVQKLQYIPYYKRLKRMTDTEFDHSPQEKRLLIGGYEVRVLPDELNVVLLTTHAFNHVITAGLGLRQVMDWQVVLEAKADILDWDKLLRYLDELHLRRMFLVLAHINVCYLGMSIDIFSVHGLDIHAEGIRHMAEKLLKWIETCGNFGHSMDLGKGKIYVLRYYGLFFRNVMRFFWLSPLEMLSWPWMKAYRAITHTAHLS